MVNLKTRKITIEWEDVGPKIPQWLEKVIADERCKSFEVKTGVSKQEFIELAVKKGAELRKKKIPLEEIEKLADAFVNTDYYIE